MGPIPSAKLRLTEHAFIPSRWAGPGQERERALVMGSLAAILGFLVAGLSEYNFGDSEVVMVAYAVMAIPFLVEASLGGALTISGGKVSNAGKAPF